MPLEHEKLTPEKPISAVGSVPGDETSKLIAKAVNCHCRWCSRVTVSTIENGQEYLYVPMRNRFVRTSAGRKKQIMAIPADTIRTQKAKGIQALAMWCFQGVRQPGSYLIQHGRDARTVLSYIHATKYKGVVESTSDDNAWARPCPTEARHGFVDSRLVNNLRDLQQLYIEARKADKQAEIIIQQRIDASWSGILTHNRLAVGPGNDGATSGKGAFDIRLTPVDLEQSDVTGYSQALLDASGIKKDEVPYFEFVWDQEFVPYVVQARSGPALPASPNYVPADVTVTRVRTLNGDEDAMAWEQEAKQLSREPGVVIYHPGGSMSSHFGVHCGINHVPYVTTYKPVVSQRIKQCVEDEPVALEALRDGIRNGLGALPVRPPRPPSSDCNKYYNNDDDVNCGYDHYAWRPALKLALFALHNYNGDHGETGAWFIGAGAGWLWRGLAAACLGEWRHYGQASISCPPTREIIFNWMFHLTPEQIIEPLQLAADEFLRGTHWQTSIGGLAWGRCALSALRLYTAMSDVMLKPTEENVKEFLSAFNTCVHMAHNGGWVFNKFLDLSDMNRAASLSRPFLLNSVVPAMIAAQSVRIVAPQPIGASAMGLTWALDPDLVTYADNPKSIKRSEHVSGSKLIQYGEECAGKFGAWLVKFAVYAKYAKVLSIPIEVERCILACNSELSSCNLHMTFKEHPGIEPGIRTWPGIYVGKNLSKMLLGKNTWICANGATFFANDLASDHLIEVEPKQVELAIHELEPVLRMNLCIYAKTGYLTWYTCMSFPLSWVTTGETPETEIEF